MMMTMMKKLLTTALTSRLQKILKTHLSSENFTRAINTYVIPSLSYSYGIISWSQTDLEGVERIMRTKMTKACRQHKKSF
jgi:hypothetical protein